MQIVKITALVLWLFILWRCITCKTTHNLTTGLTRHIRSLSFPEGSGMGIFFAVAIPIDIPDKSISLSYYFEANYGMPTINSTALEDGHYEKRSIDRRLLYDIIQSKLESYGYPGRACLLRTICESAKFPFAHNGLIGDIIRIIFVPSTSRGENLHSEIEEAERARDCSSLEEKCPISLLDVISHSFE